MKNTNHQARRQKAATKAKARKEQLRLAKAAEQKREHERKEARKNWPPEKEFPQSELLFWVQHGINYLLSNYEQGTWTPMFPALYEGQSLAPEAIAQALLAAIATNPDNADYTDAMAWSAQPRSILYTFRQRCIARLREALPADISKEERTSKETTEVLLQQVRQPHHPAVWGVFYDLKAALRMKREARAAAAAPAEQPEPVSLEGKPITPEVFEDVREMVENHEPAKLAVTPEDMKALNELLIVHEPTFPDGVPESTREIALEAQALRGRTEHVILIDDARNP